MAVPSRAQDVAIYAVATGVLVVTGVFLLGHVLNWIVGPALVVVVVVALHRLADRSRGQP